MTEQHPHRSNRRFAMGFGAGLLVASAIALLAGQTSSTRNARFGALTAEHIRLVDQSNRVVAEIAVEDGRGVVRVLDAQGVPLAALPAEALYTPAPEPPPLRELDVENDPEPAEQDVAESPTDTETQFLSGIWRDPERWRQLNRGMPITALRELLGKPESTRVYSSSERWNYGTGYVTVSTGNFVTGWREPDWTRDKP